MNILKLQLIEKSAETARVFRLKFKSLSPEKLEFEPGQFISIHIEDDNGKVQRRSYSLINTPGSDPELVYTYFQGGLASEYFKNLKEGDTVTANGALGKFTIKREQNYSKYIFIATGTGVGPFLSILSSVNFSDSEIDMLYGIRGKEEIICAKEIESFSKNIPGLSIKYCYSREDGRSSNEVRGYVQNQLKKMNIDKKDTAFYLCGHPEMIDDAVDYLQSQEVKKDNIIKEKYVVMGKNLNEK